MFVTVKCSEPMFSLDMGVTVYGEAVDESNISYEVSTDRQTWTFSVQLPISTIESNSEISTGSDIAFSFTGLDYPVNVGDNTNANQLLNFETYYHPDSTEANTECLRIPHRMDNQNTWSSTLPEGAELAHHFGLNCLSDDDITGSDPNKSTIKIINGFCCTEDFLAELNDSTNVELSAPCLCEGDTISPFLVTTDTLLGPFTYKWSGPNEYESHQQNPIDITMAGDYTVSITNENGCRVVKEIILPACIPLQELAISADTICSEDDLSTVYIHLTNTEGLRFLWSDGSMEQNLENVSAGIYSVTINSETGCERILETEVVMGYDSLAVITLTPLTDCLCNPDEPIQAFELTITDEDTPYTYAWQGPDGFTSTEQNPLVTESGDYTVTVTNAIGCERVESINIPVCSTFDGGVITSPSCFNQATGEATAYAFGEFPPFTFEWSTSETAEHIVDLPEGIHSLTITDAKDCQIVRRFEINSSPEITIFSPSNITDCSAEGQASITPDVLTGTAPFSYTWSNGQTTATANELSSGNYSLTVTDDLGCSAFFNFTLNVSQQPIVSATVTDAHCKNNDGGIALDIQPATSYIIEWSDGLMPNQPQRNNLRAGDYSVRVRNIDGCVVTEHFTVGTVESPAESWEGVEIGTVTEAATTDYCNASVEVLLGGTLEPYSVWLLSPDGAILQTYQNATDAVLFEDLCATSENAPYTVRIRDRNGCSITKSVAVELCALTVTLEEFTRPHTTESSDGSITVGIAEDYDEVTYYWSNGAEGATLNELAPGTYTVTAREKNGCTGTATFVLDGCHTLREILDEEGEVLYEVEVPNYLDFDVIISGGLFLSGQEETPVVGLLREEGSDVFTTAFPSGYSFSWQSINQNTIAENTNPIIISSDYGSGHSPRWIELTVSNGCISKTFQQPIFNCREGSEEEAADFFVLNEVRPCSGGNNGEILLGIPNLFNAEMEVYYGNPQQSISLQSDGLLGNIALISGLSAGEHQFTIIIDDCENHFTYTLLEAPVDEERLNYDAETHTCLYQGFCAGNPVSQTVQDPWLDPMNGTEVPCLVPVMCGDEKVWDEPYEKRTCRGIEYTSLLRRMIADGGYTPPFTADYLDFLAVIGDCQWVKYCTGNMKRISQWGIGGGQATFNGLTNNGCSKWKCSGFLTPNIRSCPDDDCNQIPIYALDPEDVPTDNVCTRYESFNLYGLIKAYRNGWLDQAEGFLESTLRVELQRLSLLSEEELYPAKCANAIFCAENYHLYYHDMDGVNCDEVLVPSSNSDDFSIDGIFSSIPDYDLESIITCTRLTDQTITDPSTGNVLQEVIRCRKPNCAQIIGDLSVLSDCTTTQIINYQDLFDIFGIQPFVSNPVQRLSRFDDPFLVEKIVRLNTLKFQDFTIPKLVLATSQGRAYYDYTPGDGIEAKLPVEGLAFQIEDWDTDQSLIALTNQIGGYRLIYEDSLHTWDQLIYSPQDTNFLLKNISFQENADVIQIAGLVNGDLYFHETLIASFESPSFFNLELSLDGVILDLITAQNFDKKDIEGASFSKNGDILFMGEISLEGGDINIGEEVIHPSPNRKEQLLAFYDNTDRSFALMKKVELSENTSVLKSAIGGHGIFGLLIDNADALSIENDGRTTLNEAMGKTMVASFSSEQFVTWQQAIEGNNFTVNDLLYLPDNSMFLAITFEDQIRIGNTVLASNGGYDIALVHFSENGEIISHQTYGTSEHETVEKLFFNGKLLFFAGEFWGNIQERIVGEQHFIDYTPFNNEVYISYINIESATDELILQQGNGLGIVTNTLKAYPNPFKNTFNLELNALQEGQISIEVVDLLGRSLFQQEATAVKGFNQFEVDMKNISSSQVLNVVVRFKSGNQTALQTRLIRE